MRNRVITWLERVGTPGDLGLLAISALSVGLMIIVFKGVSGYFLIVAGIFGCFAVIAMAFVMIKFMIASVREISPSSRNNHKLSPAAGARKKARVRLDNGAGASEMLLPSVDERETSTAQAKLQQG